jgi:hypothetical protein
LIGSDSTGKGPGWNPDEWCFGASHINGCSRHDGIDLIVADERDVISVNQ